MKTWTDLRESLFDEDTEIVQFREKVVKQAYECVVSVQVQQLLQMIYEPGIASKLWKCLRFIARPIIDGRMLHTIGCSYPQFRDVQIFAIPPRPKQDIRLEYQIGISDAWKRLGTKLPPGPGLSKLFALDNKFRADCSVPYGLHAEIQLFMHYEENLEAKPTLLYFGCSKRSCFLCHTFLQALPHPISTRGTHGICYPAWGGPNSNSNAAGSALKGLEDVLVSRINLGFPNFIQDKKVYFAQAVQQSTLVSDRSLDSLHRDEKVTSAKLAAAAQREERLIR